MNNLASNKTAIKITDLDIVHSTKKTLPLALKMLDSGATRQEILEATGAVVGASNINLAIPKGSICVLMGASGSGKSTVLRAVNGLNKAARGSINIACGDRHVDVTQISERELRNIRQRHVSMVFQQVALLPWRTVRGNIGLGLEFSGINKNEQTPIIDEVLELVGLSNWSNKLVHELSGGMQQRVGLARALAASANILLMDEPFSALDPIMRDKLQDELIALHSKLQKTVFFVSHDLREALKLGDIIVIMNEGRIIQSGTPEEIVLSPSNSYVKEFVSNVDPLSIMTAYNIMHDVRDLTPAGDGWLWLDDSQITKILLDNENIILKCEVNGRSSDLLITGNTELNDLPHCNFLNNDTQDAQQEFFNSRSICFFVYTSTKLREVILNMHRALAPVGVLDHNGRLVGAIGVRDIMRAVL